MIPDSKDHFGPIEEALTTLFLPALFGDSSPEVDEKLRELTRFPVRHAGLGILNPVAQAEQSFQNSVSATEPVSSSLKEGRNLDAIGCGLDMAVFLRANKQIQESNLTIQLDRYKAQETASARRRIDRTKQTGAWLTVIPNQLNGTALTAQEFQDSLRIRYGLTPLGLPHRCDGCNNRFTVGHALQCPKGGQIIQRHDRIALEWSELCKLVPKTRIVKEPEIPIFRTV